MGKKNMQSMWCGIQAITNYRKYTNRAAPHDAALPDTLNRFFARFDQHNPDTPTKSPHNPEDTMFQWPTHRSWTLWDRWTPAKCWTERRGTKSPKACAEQLARVYTDIFNTSLSQEKVPCIFKSSFIVPVPKRTHTVTINDFRPIALISVAMNCLEKLVLQQINYSPFSLPPAWTGQWTTWWHVLITPSYNT